jgi:hypothetical protein
VPLSIVLDLASSQYPRWRGQVFLTLRCYALADHVLHDIIALRPWPPHVASTLPLALLPTPHAATSPAPRTAPSTPPAPHTAPTTPPTPRAALATPAPSTSGARFANLVLVYHRRRSAPLSAPTDLGPSTSASRFANPAIVYHRRKSTTPAAFAVLAPRSEPSVYHPVAIHRDPRHIHPMLTRCAAGVLWPVDRLILTADMTTTPPDASLVPSSVCTTLADPHWRRAMEEYAALLANHTWDLVPRPPGTNVVTVKWLFRHMLTSDGSHDRYKARWVLRGFTQRPIVDYDETVRVLGLLRLGPCGPCKHYIANLLGSPNLLNIHSNMVSDWFSSLQPPLP